MRIFLLGIILSSYLFSYTIDINLKGLENSKGQIRIGLYDKEKTFLDNDLVYKGKIVKASSSNIKFENIPNGLYAISLYHDENSNNILDTNFIGIPKEGYGFSNNPSSFGAPSFEEAKFELNSDTTLNIEVKY
jgi:uncharacterized protein (DUF2141 family)